MSINFILAQMQHLRYIMPLIIEANKRDIESVVRYCTTKKCYTQVSNHLDALKQFSLKYNFRVQEYKKDFKGLTFLMDNRWPRNNLPPKTHKVVLPVMLSFVNPNYYDSYIGEVDNVIFASKFMAEYYHKISFKNLYLGCPKYDIEFDRENILKKYNIKTPKNILFIDPHPLSGKEMDVRKIYNFLKRLDYNVIVKSRRKHTETRLKNKMGDTFKGDQFFEDIYSWFPHVSMELINISDIVINNDSAVIKECVFGNTPLINFHIKVDPKRYHPNKVFTYDYLFNYHFCKQLDVNVDFNEFEESINCLLDSDFSKDFKKARDTYFYETERGRVSKRILDRLL